MGITTAQIRGARGLLDWSQSELSRRTGVSTTSIGNIESGNTQPRESTLKVIQSAFEDSGIEFGPNNAISIKSDIVKTFKGKEGFWSFYEDLFRTVSAEPGEVLVSNVDEREFEKWLDKDNLQTHVGRMQKIEGLTYKILVKHGDDHYLATSDYCEYRWMPGKQFASAPFYLYGNKLAIVLFSNEPYVMVIDNHVVAEAYKIQFKALWDLAEKPK